MKPPVSKLFSDFFNSEKAGGFILIGCTLISLIIANSAAGEGYLHFWHQKVGFEQAGIALNYPVEFWINDGLMTLFFLLVGLEIERELYIGELSTLKQALLPVFAAIGGMLAPALIHFLFNAGSGTQSGFGIPMATDIAFALGILSLLGNKVPVTLKIFLTAFAIIDDLGAILMIAIFYTKSFSLLYFGLAMGIWGILLLMNRLKVHSLVSYIIPGIALWYCMLQSGVHATISGILLAFALPFGNGDKTTCSYRLQHLLHKPVAFIIMPVFALANTGIIFPGKWTAELFSRNSLGIILGLVIGKPIGILLLSYTAVKLKISQLGEDIKWSYIFGASLLGGIGFTMSIFITLLAFDDSNTVANSKIAVLISSLLAGIAGYLILKYSIKMKTNAEAE
ncbi:MAG TPA: Na+/H+ antiporter NhaA [Flavitalea sp.]|nr:Na+/H+ antiporter NhaA [Flavitalea sp.]